MDDNQETKIHLSKEIVELNLISCIGIDEKKHRCISWEDKCLCGVKVLHKNPSPELEMKYMFSCYECTY